MNRGTCTAFAVLAALETFPGFPPDLSRQYLYAMIKSNHEVYGTDPDDGEGASFENYIKALQLDGRGREDQEPYNLNTIVWNDNEENFEKMKKDPVGTKLNDLLNIQPFCTAIRPAMNLYNSGVDAKDIDKIDLWITKKWNGLTGGLFRLLNYHPPCR